MPPGSEKWLLDIIHHLKQVGPRQLPDYTWLDATFVRMAAAVRNERRLARVKGKTAKAQAHVQARLAGCMPSSDSHVDQAVADVLAIGESAFAFVEYGCGGGGSDDEEDDDVPNGAPETVMSQDSSDATMAKGGRRSCLHGRAWGCSLLGCNR